MGVKEPNIGQRIYIDRRNLALRVRRTMDVGNAVMKITQVMKPIILPRMWQEETMEQYHMEMSHPGLERMIQTISRYYVWRKMRRTITGHCKSSMHCQKRKAATHIVQNPSLSVYPRINRPFDRCHIDLFGELPETETGFKYVLLFKCALTKWVDYLQSDPSQQKILLNVL